MAVCWLMIKRADGAGPASAAVLLPGQGRLLFSPPSGSACLRCPASGCRVDAGEVQFPDGPGPGDQRDHEACVIAARMRSIKLQGLDEDQGTLGAVSAAGGVTENRPGLLAVAEQRAQGGEGLRRRLPWRAMLTSAGLTSRRWT